jgi:glycosyltransferase involved in cell wall biosynthesis
MTILTDCPIGWTISVGSWGQNISGVDYISPKNSGEVGKIYAQADIMLNCPSSESAPITLLTGMAMGLPSISFETYGAREIIENGINGIMIRHNDHNQLADEIIRLIEEPPLVKSISKEAVKIREKLSIDNLARLLE